MISQRSSIPSRPRVERTLEIAWRFMRAAEVTWLPIEPRDLYRQFGWALYSCKETEEMFGRPNPLGLRNKVDAKTYRDRSGNYLTVFDETPFPSRIRWTLAHEIGHIMLGHLTDFEETSLNRGLSEGKYRVLEREADTFAAELLAPMAVLREIGAYRSEEIMTVCRISKEASGFRERDISRDGNKLYHRINHHRVKAQFGWYLSPINICTLNDYSAPTSWSAQTKIPEVITLGETVTHVETDDYGHFLSCPRCGNTVFSSDASYCKMCGLYLYNECTNAQGYRDSSCGRINPGDARYCEQCGSETVLTRLGLLMPYQELIDRFGAVAAALSQVQEIKTRPRDVPDDNDMGF